MKKFLTNVFVYWNSSALFLFSYSFLFLNSSKFLQCFCVTFIDYIKLAFTAQQTIPKSSGLKQSHFIFSHFSWSRLSQLVLAFSWIRGQQGLVIENGLSHMCWGWEAGSQALAKFLLGSLLLKSHCTKQVTRLEPRITVQRK